MAVCCESWVTTKDVSNRKTSGQISCRAGYRRGGVSIWTIIRDFADRVDQWSHGHARSKRIDSPLAGFCGHFFGAALRIGKTRRPQPSCAKVSMCPRGIASAPSGSRRANPALYGGVLSRFAFGVQPAGLI